MNQWDVAIIGGGPAGCSAGLSLAKKGLRVVVLEAKTYPHDKMCGEFISPEGVSLLTSLGMEEPLAALNPVLIQQVCLTAPDGTAWESCLPGTAFGISRKVLDQALAQQVQAQGGVVQEASPVTGLSGSIDEGFVLEIGGRTQPRQLQARAVIAAHGKRGTLDRVLRRRFLRQRQPFVAVKAHFHGPPIPGRIELHAFQGGYCGLSEIEGGDKVACFLAHESVFQISRGPRGVDGFVDWMRSQNAALQAWFQWAVRIHPRWITIAQVSFGSKPAIEGDVLMAGDAAGLIVPLAGDGISMALEGGLLAAGYITRLLEGEINPGTLRRAYPRAWERRFRTRLRFGQALQPLLLRPNTASAALRMMNSFPSLGRFLIRQTRGSTQSGFSALQAVQS
jgi:menaquinone-9 beta-reductase